MWSNITTCMYSVVTISVRVELSPGLRCTGVAEHAQPAARRVRTFPTSMTFRSRLFLNKRPVSLSAITCVGHREVPPPPASASCAGALYLKVGR